MSERGLLAAGKIGINLNTDENVQDGDDISATGVENLGIVGGAAHDVVSGQGGAGTGGTLDTTTVLSLSGGDGPDSLTGGKGNDFLEGDGNDDLLDAAAGTTAPTGRPLRSRCT